jgi:hypothetical protein
MSKIEEKFKTFYLERIKELTLKVEKLETEKDNRIEKN